jgi:hypothetical protein
MKMTPEEINAAVLNPGPEGVYRFEYDGRVQAFRRWEKGSWYAGYTDTFNEDVCNQSFRSAMTCKDKVTNGYYTKGALEQGHVMIHDRNLDGSLPDTFTPPGPLQLDLFQ